MVAGEYYNQHHDPFIHQRHGIFELNFNIMNHITFIVLLLNFLIKTYSLNILIVCYIELFLIISSHLLNYLCNTSINVFTIYQHIMFQLANLPNKVLSIKLICLCSSMLWTFPCTSNNY